MSLLEERINESRLERGMSASELARAVGVTSAAVSRWEKGQVKNLRMEHLFTIARLLDINPEWLATGRGHKKGHLLNQQGSIHEPGPPTYEHLNREEQILVDVYRRLSHSTRRNLKDFVLELAERLQ